METKKKGICEHNTRRYTCVDCKGNGICKHNKKKYSCVDCKGTGICQHNRMKYRCKDCLCIHGLQRKGCYHCKPTKTKPITNISNEETKQE